MLAIDRDDTTFLYSQVIDLIDEQLRAGTLRRSHQRDRCPVNQIWRP